MSPRTDRRRRLAWSLAGMVLVAVALLWRDGAFSPRRAPHAGGAPFPDVVLTDQHGRSHRLYDDLLKGRTVAVNTFFAGCGDVCPLGTAKLLELKALLGARHGRDIVFYSLSVDPLHDTPQALAAYAERFRAGTGWLFLTGREADMKAAVRALGLGTLQPTSPRDSHSTTLMVGRVSTGQWMKSSATDNPRFVAANIQTFLGWPETVPGSLDYTHARPMPEMSNGQFLFHNACSACHTIGGGERIGPDLAHVGERRERAWLERFILAPDAVIAAGDPTATAMVARYGGVRMPNLGLARSEVADLLDHIAQRSRASPAARGEVADGPAAHPTPRSH